MKRRTAVTLITCIGLLSIIGCGGKSEPSIKNMFDIPPKWYLDNKVGYVVGVGSAIPNKSLDLNFQKNEALLNARTDLAKNIKVAIRARDESNAEQNKDGTINKNIELRTESVTQMGLENSKILNSEFGKNGTLFIQLGVKTDIITGKVK
jgi:hypothetical protein